MTLSVDEVKCCRKITVKGIYGRQEVLKTFVAAFKKKLTETANLLPDKGVSMSELLDETQESEISTFRGSEMLVTSRTNNGGKPTFKGTLRSSVLKPLETENDDDDDEEVVPSTSF
jgi:hypothetical protein